MQNAAWQVAVKASADPQRAAAYWEKFNSSAAPALKKCRAEQARILLALFSGSQAMSELLIRHPEWLASVTDPETIRFPRQDQGLRREIGQWLTPLIEAKDHAAALARLRQFQQRELVRIAARDLARLGNAVEITRDLSNLADACLDAAYRIVSDQLVSRFGQPHHQDVAGRWQPTSFCVLGLGKLGGQDLNYSSDIDLMFLYADEGEAFREVPRPGESAGRGLANHQFFKRLAEALVAELTRLTDDGMLFRVDLRLRPEGNAGPIARSLPSCENYYAQWGQTWERMMLIKARGVAGDLSLAGEFLETIQTFRYPRSLSERVLGEVAAMKQRIETEVLKAGELERNVKLGRGGIREIEFIAQTLQLLHAGHQPFLQEPRTLPALQKLHQYELLPQATLEALTAAYGFFRDVEHRLQMDNNQQTHTIGVERKARERLAALMDCPSLAAFERARAQHANRVREAFDALLRGQTAASRGGLPAQFDGAEAAWREVLGAHGFRDVERSLHVLRTFAHGPGYVHVSPRTIELALELVPRLLALCPRADRPPTADRPVLSDPDRVLTRLGSFVEAYGSRALLFETWVSNPSLFTLLIWLFDRSEFLAEVAIRTPDLVDELELSGQLRRRKTAGEILRDLQHGRGDADQRLWLRRYHETELMRIGLREILGLADFEQNLVELSALADACLSYALEVVLRRHRLAHAPFVIIGLGKLGGGELNYGSDLDITFVARAGVEDLSRLHPLAIEVMGMLSDSTELGVAFRTDPRLRPDGEKGLLVNTLAAYEEYYRRRAQLWEIQALTRVRAVAGDLELGAAFQRFAAAATDFRQAPPPCAAFTPDWRRQIAAMRRRIEKERTARGTEPLAIKTGAGGLVDAEFVAQALCLENGWAEPNTLRALERGREAACLPKAEATALIENYRALRRVEGILRRWSYEGETVLPTEPAPLYRVAVRCGFSNAEQFLAAVGRYRAAIRRGYEGCFG